MRLVGGAPPATAAPVDPAAEPEAAANERGDGVAGEVAASAVTGQVLLPSVDPVAPAAAEAARLPAGALNFPHTEAERRRLTIFRDLWQRGHYMTPGAKFGGDYLVYPGEPARYHAHFVALVTPTSRALTPLQLVSLGRLATAVKKTFLLCDLDDAGRPTYVSIEWTGIT